MNQSTLGDFFPISNSHQIAFISSLFFFFFFFGPLPLLNLTNLQGQRIAIGIGVVNLGKHDLQDIVFFPNLGFSY